MYESFYGFREKPFSLLPDPGFLFLSKQHRIALGMLEYGILNQAGFVVITGEIGAGKTTLLRHLLANTGHDVTIGLISNTHPGFGDLLQWILNAFGVDHEQKNKIEMYQLFTDFIVDEYAKGRRTVLIIDEAQNMDTSTLEELRMLSNINSGKDQVLQMILCGQPGLRDTLREPALEQFAQRITSDYHLKTLSEEDTTGYIQHRLSVAGGDAGIFDLDACKKVFEATAGTPRLVNLICDTALVYGYAEQTQYITSTLVEEVVKEKREGGLFRTPETVKDSPPKQS